MSGHLLLVRGPVFSGKSQKIQQSIEDDEIDFVVDYSSVWASLRGVRRDPDTGKLPVREDDDPFNQIGNSLKGTIAAVLLDKGFRVGVSTGKSDISEIDRYSKLAKRTDSTFEVRTIEGNSDDIEKIIEDLRSRQCEKAYKRWNKNYQPRRRRK